MHPAEPRPVTTWLAYACGHRRVCTHPYQPRRQPTRLRPQQSPVPTGPQHPWHPHAAAACAATSPPVLPASPLVGQPPAPPLPTAPSRGWQRAGAGSRRSRPTAAARCGHRHHREGARGASGRWGKCTERTWRIGQSEGFRRSIEPHVRVNEDGRGAQAWPRSGLEAWSRPRPSPVRYWTHTNDTPALPGSTPLNPSDNSSLATTWGAGGGEDMSHRRRLELMGHVLRSAHAPAVDADSQVRAPHLLQARVAGGEEGYPAAGRCAGRRLFTPWLRAQKLGTGSPAVPSSGWPECLAANHAPPGVLPPQERRHSRSKHFRTNGHEYWADRAS